MWHLHISPVLFLFLIPRYSFRDDHSYTPWYRRELNILSSDFFRKSASPALSIILDGLRNIPVKTLRLRPTLWPWWPSLIARSLSPFQSSRFRVRIKDIGIVERLYWKLKAAIIYHATSCTKTLPLVLLGLKYKWKTGIEWMPVIKNTSFPISQ